jgi:glutathione peroxidase
MLNLTLALLLSGAPMSVHDFQVKTIDGKDVSLSQYKGKALLIVNTASECGYTPQYKGLEALYQEYKAKGVEVLAFPSNDFGGQEPGTASDIKKFCELRYKTTFPLFDKVVVKGDGAHPLYKYLQAHQKGHEVKWNFNKFLVDANGQLVGYFESKVAPESKELHTALDGVLPK